jgi:acyl-coenzyme A thioesterase PaaI-like protein
VSDDAALQDRYAPNGACFGCGPRNEKGLRIKSHARGDEVVATWRAEKFHEAYEGALSGGVIGTLMDCHSNWTAAYHLMKRTGAQAPPCTVTAQYAITLKRPTPTDGEIEIVARPVEISGDRVTVEAELHAGGKVCATSRGLFVAVEPDHPAYHRW